MSEHNKVLIALAAVGVIVWFSGRVVKLPSPPPQKPYNKVLPSNLTENAISAWAVYEPKALVRPFKYEPRPLGDEDVEIKITHCGICRSDIHQIDNGWSSPATFPMVPGHEIVGVVSALGRNVSSLKIGDRVGVGAQCLSCLDIKGCASCKNKLEQYCPKSVYTYNSRYADGAVAYGGYATRVRVHEKFALLIPDNLRSAEVAPLLCAGATVFEPIRRWNMGKEHKVGIIGIGGLGHLAVQFAAAVGAEVTAISTSQDKKDLALKLGATHFISTPEEKKAAQGTFDFIIQTDNVTTDLSSYVRLLKPLGSLIVVGIPEDRFSIVPDPIVSAGRCVAGSSIASPTRLQEMLKLASEKNIRAMIQEFPISEVNEALKAVREGKPRFRYVLKIQDE